MSSSRELRCAWCGDEHPFDQARCPCGGPLDRVEPLGPIDELGSVEDGGRVAELVGVGEGWVSLGEGGTPLVREEGVGAWLKLEGVNPTGSFKDRGASVVVSHARRFGAGRVVEDSSGNAGAAVAAYAARAGLACEVFSPEHVTEAKRARMEALGARVSVVEGPRSGVTEAAWESAQREGSYYASHTFPPFFVEGCSSIAFELVDELGGAPEAVVTPCAMGSIVLGCHQGFSRLVEGGVIGEVPPIFAVQASGVDPVAERFGRGGSGENRFADGLLVPEPPREEQIVEAVEASGGVAVSVGEEATREAMGDLHAGGVLAEPSSATALAGARALREEGVLGGVEPVLVLTGQWSPA